MLFDVLDYLIEYLTYFIGGFIQALFILLPVTLKNWEDDLLNSLTYVSFQIFVAGIIFIISPWVLEVKSASLWAQTGLLVGTGFIAVFRVVKVIPFEFTYPIKLKVIQAKNITFTGFLTNERLNTLNSLDFQQNDAELRYNAFREKLARLKTEKTTSSLEEIAHE